MFTTNTASHDVSMEGERDLKETEHRHPKQQKFRETSLRFRPFGTLPRPEFLVEFEYVYDEVRTPVLQVLQLR